MQCDASFLVSAGRLQECQFRHAACVWNLYECVRVQIGFKSAEFPIYCRPANGAAASSEVASSSDDSDDDAAAKATAAAGARPRLHASHAAQQPDSDGSGSDGFPMAAGPPPDADPAAAAEGVEGPSEDPARPAAAGVHRGSPSLLIPTVNCSQPKDLPLVALWRTVVPQCVLGVADCNPSG